MFNSPPDQGEEWKKAAVDGTFRNSHDRWSNMKNHGASVRARKRYGNVQCCCDSSLWKVGRFDDVGAAWLVWATGRFLLRPEVSVVTIAIGCQLG